LKKPEEISSQRKSFYLSFGNKLEKILQSHFQSFPESFNTTLKHLIQNIPSPPPQSNDYSHVLKEFTTIFQP
jgi:hypothetical protein